MGVESALPIAGAVVLAPEIALPFAFQFPGPALGMVEAADFFEGLDALTLTLTARLEKRAFGRRPVVMEFDDAIGGGIMGVGVDGWGKLGVDADALAADPNGVLALEAKLEVGLEFESALDVDGSLLGSNVVAGMPGVGIYITVGGTGLLIVVLPAEVVSGNVEVEVGAIADEAISTPTALGSLFPAASFACRPSALRPLGSLKLLLSLDPVLLCDKFLASKLYAISVARLKGCGCARVSLALWACVSWGGFKVCT